MTASPEVDTHANRSASPGVSGSTAFTNTPGNTSDPVDVCSSMDRQQYEDGAEFPLKAGYDGLVFYRLVNNQTEVSIEKGETCPSGRVEIPARGSIGESRGTFR